MTPSLLRSANTVLLHTYSFVVLSPIVDKDDMSISKRLIVLILHLRETWSINVGKLHLPKHWHTLTYHLMAPSVLKKCIMQILLVGRGIWCIHHLKILPAIKTPQMMLRVLPDDIGKGSHEVDHLVSSHDGDVLTQCVNLS